MGVTRAQPAAGPLAVATGDADARPLKSRLRLLALAAGSAAILVTVAWVAGELAAARVPQHRAALEDLIRHETGLNVSFRELSVRWGWYGPEAVFHSVELGEPAAGGALLRAPQLIVGLDAWRMVRSGHFEAGRITLVSPDIDLGAAGLSAPAVAGAAGGAHEDVLTGGARVLSGWRGGRIDIEAGTLRARLPAGTPLTLMIRRAQLRRLGAKWSADARVLLPASLGYSAHLSLELTGDPAQPRLSSGTISFQGQRLEFAGWRSLGGAFALLRYLPQAGNGNLELHAAFAHGALLAADGSLNANALEWSAPGAAAPALTLDLLRGQWKLLLSGGEWVFTAAAAELGTAAAQPASLSVVSGADGGTVSGSAQHVPLAAIAAIASWYVPQLPLTEVALGGEVRELTFDWSAQRPAGRRLHSSAQLEGLMLATPSRTMVLSGLSGHVTGVGEHLVADLTAHGAHLALARAQPLALDDLDIAARLVLAGAGGGWQLSTDDLQVRRAGSRLAASGVLAADGPALPPHVRAHVALKDADAALVASLLGPEALTRLGAAAASQVSAGRIESADLALRGSLDTATGWDAPGSDFSGAVTLRDVRVSGGELWPETQDLDARIDWHGARVHAAIDGARSGTFELSAGSADWDARGAHATRLAARLSGSAQEALLWLREHPQVAAWAPGVEHVDLRGDTLLDFDITLPASAAKARRQPAVRVAAVLDGAQLRPVAGVPSIDALRGTLVFLAGHLQRSTLTGQWLGGPVSLNVAEHREHGANALAISARGFLGVRQALLAAGGSVDDAPLSGSAEWSALVTLLPAAGGGPRWRVRADSNLVGVASRLPEPFAKLAGAAVPLRVELQAADDHGELRVSLSDRLRALAALGRGGEDWRIERGAVRLAASFPALPGEAVLEVDGRLSRLDLPAYLALWRQASRDAALPALRARLSAAQLLAGTRSYAEVSVAVDAARGAGELKFESPQLSGALHWPAPGDGAQPALLSLASFELAQPGDAALGAGLAALLGPSLQLAVEDLRWQGHSLGLLQATLATHGDALDVSELHLRGASGDTHASAHCAARACRASVSLDSQDAAATLAALGLRPDLAADHAILAAEVQWLPAAPLASLDGHLHMQLQDGVARAGASDSNAIPFALLSVPALMAGLNPEVRDAGEPGLRFSRLTADFELRQGEATTSDLHFDGDAEILVRGRVGLLARDYDEQAWILRGEERLPAAVRRLGPTPRVAAVWLSLRELFTGSGADRPPAVLRLRGTWNDPIVTPVQ